MKRTKLDELMREIGITNTGLAAVTGLHRKTIQEAREELVKPRYRTLRILSKALGVDVYDLQKRTDKGVFF